MQRISTKGKGTDPSGPQPSVLVLGAGVVGIATAYSLARRGARVTILDRGLGPALGTSFANGAQLSYVYTDALASPSLLKRIPALIAGMDPAFRLRPSLDPDFLKWGLAFLRNCTGDCFEENTLAGLRLGLRSRIAMHRLLEKHPLEFGFAAPGKIHIYDDEESFAAARSVMDQKKAAGAAQEAITPSEAAYIEPALGEVSNRIVGAIYSPQEEIGDARLFCKELLEVLKVEYGVTTHFGISIKRLDLEGSKPAVVVGGDIRIEADQIMICTGVDTPRLLRGTGIKVPIWPMKGYSLTAPAGEDAPKTSITDVSRKLVFCNLGGRMRIAGLADLGNRNTNVDPKRLAAFVATARESLPGAAAYDAVESTWAGLRPMTPTSLPIIRRARQNVVLNVGHGSLGWTYAMGAAEHASSLMLEKCV